MLRQPTVSVSTPPMVGPIARPTDAMPVQMPMARAFLPGSGNAALDQGQRGDVDGGGAYALYAATEGQDAEARGQRRRWRTPP